jgi:hypothetical protein
MADCVTGRRDDASLHRWYHALPFVGIGTACVVAGGMVAAITARNPTESGTWAAAYLVLVAGVAQIALGVGQALLVAEVPRPRLVIAELILWNCANTGVLAGSLLGVEPLIDAGGGLLVAVLALFAHRARGAHGRARWLLFAYRLLVVALLVSVPIGLLLARAGPI